MVYALMQVFSHRGRLDLADDLYDFVVLQFWLSPCAHRLDWQGLNDRLCVVFESALASHSNRAQNL
jgi:hypothetical protein